MDRLRELPAAEEGGTEMLLPALAAAALLSACGGGDGTHGSMPAAFADAAAAPTRRILGQPTATAATSANSVALPTATELMDWAERVYWMYFPDHRPDLHAAPYVYRYPGTGNYLGLDGNDIYILGPVSGGPLVRVGSLSDFAGAVLASTRAASDEAAARFLHHAQASGRLDEIAQVRALGYGAWLDAQMAMPYTDPAWNWLVARGYGNVDERALYDGGAPTVDYAVAYQMVNAADSLRPRLALALSEMFVVSALVASMPWTGLAMAHYWDQLSANTYGNFRQLLEDLTLNPAMGAWLNTRGNLKEDPATGRVPDENYAREVMQLFTIGLVQLELDGTPRRDANGRTLPTYSQDDVSQLARVFTGYDWWDDGRRFVAPATNNGRPYPEYTRRAMVFDAGRHSTLEKRFLGTTVPAGTAGPAALRIALDTLFQHPNVGPFFARQMIQRLVTGNPSPAYVARVAARFNNNGSGVRGDLKAVWRAILLDDEARGADSLVSPTFGKLREPMLRVFQWARTFSATSRSGDWTWSLSGGDATMWFGQRPLWSPSVFNFFRPGYVPPGTAMAAAGATAPEFQIVNESTVSQWVNFIDNNNLIAAGPGFELGDNDIRYAAEVPLAHDTPALVARLNLLLCAGQMSAQTQRRIVDILNLSGSVGASVDDPGRRFRVIAAVTLMMSCAEYLVQK